MKRPYKAPYGILGCYITIFTYLFMLFFADKIALYTAGILSVLCIIFWYFYTQHKKNKIPALEDEIGDIEEPTAAEKRKMDKEYSIWKWSTIVITVISLAIYLIPMIIH